MSNLLTPSASEPQHELPEQHERPRRRSVIAQRGHAARRVMSYPVVSPNAGRGAIDCPATSSDHRESTALATVMRAGHCRELDGAVVERADGDRLRHGMKLEASERIEAGLASRVGISSIELCPRRDPRRVLVDEEVQRPGERRGEVELVVERVDESGRRAGNGWLTELLAPSATGTTM